MGQLIVNGDPARLLSFAGAGGGGGGGTPEFTITTLADNSEGAQNITISQDYHNFDIIGFDISNTTAADSLRIFATPAMMDAIFAVTGNSENKINLNFRNTIKYACYGYDSSLLQFTLKASRETVCWKIVGYKCTNMTVTEEVLFVTNTKSGTAITLDLTGDDKHFFDYDYLFFAANSSQSDYSEFQPCQDIFYCPANVLRREPLSYVFNAYNSQTIVSLTDQTASAAKYLFVSGMKFS